MAWWEREQRGPAGSGAENRREVPKGVWSKCAGCGEIQVESEIRANLGVCPLCQHHHVLTAPQRLEMLVDSGSFEEFGANLVPQDPLNFRDTKRYCDRLEAARRKTGFFDAVLTGLGRIDQTPVAVGVMAFEFLGGSMGSVVGERITRLFEAGLEQGCPVVLSSASGGARMQEGILSLMQMAKTCAALSRLRQAGLPYISLLHHPTTGGVAASYSMLGDLIVAEPGALIGFAGPRVIEQTIRQKLPEGFQRSEFLLEHGMIDMIVARAELRDTVRRLLGFLTGSSRLSEPLMPGHRSAS